MEKKFRVRTTVGQDNEITIPINQTFDILEILSLQLNQKNLYEIPKSGYGIVCGRVLANKAFGIPNAKVSIFIPKDSSDDESLDSLYDYSNVTSYGGNNIRYNLLDNSSNDLCHQEAGDMPDKRVVLDNNDVIEVFDKYYKYTTSTNKAGDYMIYGVPVGQQTLHCDIDLSDIGVLSQKPRDMYSNGYTINDFDSPTKFKTSKNLDTLVQIKSYNKDVFVYPFWGDRENTDYTTASITRCDIDVSYKFETTCIFMGSIITDRQDAAISHKCTPSSDMGVMENMIGLPGKIEMIRKTFDGKVEYFQIDGNELIDENGVFCYQIPMNLDYVVTDEFGNMVPTDDPTKGIATRAKVRFRVSVRDGMGGDKKHARYLIPNNPHFDDDFQEDYPEFNASRYGDYEFGSKTREENYANLLWNNVYTVKNFIPRLQKSNLPLVERFSGLKYINFYGDNNPFPYNNLHIKLNMQYRLTCTVFTLLICVIYWLNAVFGVVGGIFIMIGDVFYRLGRVLKLGFVKNVGCFFYQIAYNMNISISGDICENEQTDVFVPGLDSGIVGFKTLGKQVKYLIQEGRNCKGIEPKKINTNVKELLNCVIAGLAEKNRIISYNFYNDWINGVLYMPLWRRRVWAKKRFLFGLIKKPLDGTYCNGSFNVKGLFSLKIFQNNTMKREFSNGELKPIDNPNITPIHGLIRPLRDLYKIYIGGGWGAKTYSRGIGAMKVQRGVIVKKETIAGENVYYYKASVLDNSSRVSKDTLQKLFATDIVLLGTVDDCDKNGVPQFHKRLSSTTFNMPSFVDEPEQKQDDNENDDALANDNGNKRTYTDKDSNESGESYTDLSDNQEIVYSLTSSTGQSWINGCGKGQGEPKTYQEELPNAGLFFGIDCNTGYSLPKTTINLPRICEYGVEIDSLKEYLKDSDTVAYLNPDGFISYDEIYDVEGRSMFATLNSNNLRVEKDKKTNMYHHTFVPLYLWNFDGSLQKIMKNDNRESFKQNHKAELPCTDYIRFRYAKNGEASFYQSNFIYPFQISKNTIGIFNNSLYFYFGIKDGKTAIDKFRELYYTSCEDEYGVDTADTPNIIYQPNSICKDNEDGDGYIVINAKTISKPYDITIDIEDSEEDSLITIGEIKGCVYTNLILCNHKPKDEEYSSYDTIPFVDGEYLRNGVYVITITTAEDEVVVREDSAMLGGYNNINVVKSDFNIHVDSYKGTNGLPLSTMKEFITNTDLHQKDSEIGGYITISDLPDYKFKVELSCYLNESATESFNFSCEVEILEENNGVKKINVENVDCVLGTEIIETPPYICNSIDETLELQLALPRNTDGNAGLYNVVIMPICGEELLTDKKTIFKNISIGQGKELSLQINGIDYSLLKNFEARYSNGSYTSIQGWKMENLFKTGTYLSKIPDGKEEGSNFVWNNTFIEDTIMPHIKVLSSSTYSVEPYDTPYSWTEDYILSDEDILAGIEEVYISLPEYKEEDGKININGYTFTKKSDFYKSDSSISEDMPEFIQVVANDSIGYYEYEAALYRYTLINISQRLPMKRESDGNKYVLYDGIYYHSDNEGDVYVAVDIANNREQFIEDYLKTLEYTKDKDVIDSLISSMNDVIYDRTELANEAINAFCIRDVDSSAAVELSVDGGFPPISQYIGYEDELTEENDEGEQSTRLLEKYYFNTTDGYVGGIIKGCNDKIDNTNKDRCPFTVGIRDKNNISVPSGFNRTPVAGTNYYVNDWFNQFNMFNVYIERKPYQYNYISWGTTIGEYENPLINKVLPYAIFNVNSQNPPTVIMRKAMVNFRIENSIEGVKNTASSFYVIDDENPVRIVKKDGVETKDLFIKKEDNQSNKLYGVNNPPENTNYKGQTTLYYMEHDGVGEYSIDVKSSDGNSMKITANPNFKVGADISKLTDGSNVINEYEISYLEQKNNDTIHLHLVLKTEGFANKDVYYYVFFEKNIISGHPLIVDNNDRDSQYLHADGIDNILSYNANWKIKDFDETSNVIDIEVNTNIDSSTRYVYVIAVAENNVCAVTPLYSLKDWTKISSQDYYKINSLYNSTTYSYNNSDKTYSRSVSGKYVVDVTGLMRKIS